MKSQAKTFDEYISEAPEKRIGALKELRELCLIHLPDHSASMAYKIPLYKNGDQVKVAFASQKQHLSVYFLIHKVILQQQRIIKRSESWKGLYQIFKPRKN